MGKKIKEVVKAIPESISWTLAILVIAILQIFFITLRSYFKNEFDFNELLMSGVIFIISVGLILSIFMELFFNKDELLLIKSNKFLVISILAGSIIMFTSYNFNFLLEYSSTDDTNQVLFRVKMTTSIITTIAVIYTIGIKSVLIGNSKLIENNKNN